MKKNEGIQTLRRCWQRKRKKQLRMRVLLTLMRRRQGGNCGRNQQETTAQVYLSNPNCSMSVMSFWRVTLPNQEIANFGSIKMYKMMENTLGRAKGERSTSTINHHCKF
jgi:hypothetical protein